VRALVVLLALVLDEVQRSCRCGLMVTRRAADVPGAYS
jgi:hypothetical protein